MPDNKHKTIRFTALVFAAVIAFTSASALFSPKTSAASDAQALVEINNQISDVKKQLDDIASQQAAIAEKLKAAKNDKNQSIAAKMLIEEQIESLKDEQEYLNLYIDGLETSINELDTRISDTQTKYDEYYELYKTRIRANYENGDLSYLEVFLTSKNFSELLTRIDYTAYMIDYDKTLLSNMETALSSIKSNKYELEQKKKESEEAVYELELNMVEQYDAAEDLDTQIENLKSDESALAAQQKKYNQMEAELDAQVSELMDKQKAYTGGYLIWPVYGYSRVSSPFGWRELYGEKDFHNGMDIPAPKGTDIHAANAGTVILAGWVNTGGGNKIVIDHGGGVSTIYCHCSKLLVKEGDVVEQGDVIALVGTTGNSTGNHLHFGIYKNKEYLNPANYINFDNDPADMKSLF